MHTDHGRYSANLRLLAHGRKCCLYIPLLSRDFALLLEYKYKDKRDVSVYACTSLYRNIASQVWLANCIPLNKVVAIKLMDLENFGANLV